MSKTARIRCDAIDYRKGFIEVLGDIHPGLVSLETWSVDPQVDIGVMSLDASDWKEGQILHNTELELTPAQARDLAGLLLAAADAAEV